MFRMFQGWLSMSETSPGEGTLMVNPLLNKATAYFLLRPFFQPKKGPAEAYGSAFLESDNWKLEEQSSPVLQGAVPSNCQELNATLHPHLDLEHAMVHVPSVRPGDYVAWHCDSKSSLGSAIDPKFADYLNQRYTPWTKSTLAKLTQASCTYLPVH